MTEIENIKSLYNKIIEYKDFDDEFSVRNDFLNANDLNEDNALLSNNKPFKFLPNDVIEKCYQVDGRYRYHIVMAGIMPSGKKIVVSLLTKPYFLIRVPDEYLGLDVLDDKLPEDAYSKLKKFTNAVNDVLAEHNIYHCNEITTIRGFHHTGFQRIKGFYIKIPFNTIGQRRNAINLISLEANKNNRSKAINILGYACHTAHDDLTCYYRVASRDSQWKLCGWNNINEYKITKCPYGKSTVEFIQCNIDSICVISDDQYNSILKRDNSYILSWDIECSRGANDGSIPDGCEETDKVFMIGMTYSRYWDSKPIFRLCIVSEPCNTSDNDVTIQCNSQEEVLHIFGKTIGKLQPEFISGFNDGDFDWPFIVEKAKYYNLLEYWKRYMSIIYEPTVINDNELIILQKKYKGNPTPIQKLEYICDKMVGTHHRDGKRKGIEFRHAKTKIDTDTYSDTYSMDFFGYVAIDVRCVFRGVYKNPDESSLNYFLKINNIDEKEDMPIIELFDIYNNMQDAIKNNNTDRINDLKSDYSRAKSYCIYDAEACHLLMHKRNIIMDSREVSNISYTSFYDAIYRADGMKVQNMLNSRAQMRDIMYTNISGIKLSDSKYPGAYVVPPIKGVYTSKLTIRERVTAGKNNITYPYYTDDKNYDQWTDLTDEQIKYMENIVSIVLPHIDNTLNEDDIKECAKNLVYSAGATVDNISNSNSNSDSNDLNNNLSNRLHNLLVKFLCEQTGRPIIGIDFSSLYPSIMMALNLSKETIITQDYNDPNGIEKLEAKANRLIKLGYKLHLIEFPYGIDGNIRNIRGYSVRHTYDPSNAESDPIKDGFGLFPSILYELKNSRNAVKKFMKKSNTTIEETEKRVEPLKKELSSCADPVRCNEIKKLIDDILLNDEYKGVLFDSAYYTSKQLAIKVFMNTFYGVTGNQISPMFMLELAGGVTTAGQYNIKNVINFVKNLKCNVIYGDTDSAYIVCPEYIYKDIDVEYYSGKMSKEEYWTKLVEYTFKNIVDINDKVNQMLFEDNGTYFLRTDYEEVLFPSLFASKKKYAGIAHEEIVNFNPNDLFIRGIDINKRGIPEIFKKVCMEILWRCMSMKELGSLRYIVESSIGNIYNRKWKADDFVRKGSYKPNKKNISVHTFVRRMKEERNIIIRPVEKFDYVYVKKYPFRHDHRGRTSKLLNGDYMELVETVNNNPDMEINLDQYMTGGIIGQLGRLITYHKDFEYPVDKSLSLDDMEKVYYKNAVNWVEQLCSKYTIKYSNPCRVYQKAYRTINKKIKSSFDDFNGGSCISYLKCADGKDLMKEIYDKIDKELHKECIEYADMFVKSLIKKNSMIEIRNEYLGTRSERGVCDIQINIIDNTVSELESELRLLIKDNDILINIEETILEEVVDIFRKAIDVDFDDEKIVEILGEYLTGTGADIYEEAVETSVERLREYGDVIDNINNILSSMRTKLGNRKRMMEIKNKIANIESVNNGMRPITISVDDIINTELSTVDLSGITIM